HRRDLVKALSLAPPAPEGAAIGVIDVILLDPMILIEAELADHLHGSVARREHFEHHLGWDTTFDPLEVRAPVSFWPPEHHQSVGSGADLGVSFDGVPQQVACDEDVWIVPEQRLEPTLDGYDPAELPGILRHRPAVSLG